MSNEEHISWHQNTPTSPIFCSAGDSNYYKFEGPSFPSHNEDTISSSFEKRDETPLGELVEDGVKEDSETSDQSKKQKRIRSAEVHNHNERLRRQRLKEKLKALQELIPNCSKRDKLSTFDDAIKYINTLQNQVQVLMGAGYSTFSSLQTMKSIPGMQIPSPAPFLQACPPVIGTEYENGMKMEASATLDIPTSHAGFPSPYLLPSSAATILPAPDGFSAIQGPLGFTSSAESHGSRSVTSPSSQGPTSQQSSTRRESTARVLPSKIVQPHHGKEEW